MGLLDLLGIRLQPSELPESYHEKSSLATLKLATEIQNLYGWGDHSRMAIPALYRGGQLLEDLSAQLPWSSWRGGKHTDQAAARDPERVAPTPALLLDPSPFMGRDEVIRMIVNSLIHRGRSHLYLQLQQGDPPRPRFATPVNPDEVAVTWEPTGDRMRREYRWRNQVMVDGWDFLTIDLVRVAGMPHGVGPIDAARAVLQGVISTDEWARKLFVEAAVPSLTLSHPGKLNHTEAMELLELWEDTHQGGRGTGVLAGGIEANALSITPEQAQFLQTRAWGVQEIARLLGIPQHFLNAGQPAGSSSSLTYTNVQAVFRELTMVTLYPTYLRRIEAAFTSLLPRGQEAQFDLSDLLKADDGNRFTSYKTALEAGIVTKDEVREWENLPALGSAAALPAPAPEEVTADAAAD